MHKTLHWILRIGTAGIFIGHGMFGVIGGKVGWLPYFAAVGITPAIAWPLMRAIGIFDVSIAISILLRPSRPALYYMVSWGFWTALLRPLAGEGWAEFFERFPNWIVPLAFLFMQFPSPFYLKTAIDKSKRLRFISWCLVLGTAVHFLGHGAYGAIVAKKLWYTYMAAYGFDHAFVDAYHMIKTFGWIEMALGAIILLRPARGPVLLALIFLCFDPFARLLVSEPVWEFVERFGNIAAPLALLVVIGRPLKLRDWFLPKSPQEVVALSSGNSLPWWQPAPSEIAG